MDETLYGVRLGERLKESNALTKLSNDIQQKPLTNNNKNSFLYKGHKNKYSEKTSFLSIEPSVIKTTSDVQTTPIQLEPRLELIIQQYFLSEWERITDNKFLIDAIIGYNIPFAKVPYQLSPPKVSIAPNEANCLNTAINKFIDKSAIEKCQATESQFLSHYFLIPKSFRKVHIKF